MSDVEGFNPEKEKIGGFGSPLGERIEIRQGKSKKRDKSHIPGGGGKGGGEEPPSEAEIKAVQEFEQKKEEDHQNRDIKRTEEEKQELEKLKSLKSRFWRLGGSEADARVLENIAAAQQKVMELEMNWRKEGPKIDGVTSEIVEQILQDKYPLDKLIDLRLKLKKQKESSLDVTENIPESKQTFDRIELYQIGHTHGLIDIEMDQMSDSELAKEIGNRIEIRDKKKAEAQISKPQVASGTEVKTSSSAKIKSRDEDPHKDSEEYGLDAMEVEREKNKVLREKEARSNRAGEDILLGKEKKLSESEAIRSIIGKSDEEKRMEDSFHGDASEKNDKEGERIILGRSAEDIRAEKEALDTMLGQEYQPERKVVEQKEYKFEVKAVVAELSEYVNRYALQQAQEKFREIFDESNFFKRMWFNHTSENFYVTQYYNEIREKIEKDKNLMTLLERRVAGKLESKTDKDQATYNVMDAIVAAYVEDLGIKKQERGENIKEDAAMNHGMGNLFYRAAKENWERPQFETELNNLFETIDKKKFSKDGEVRGKVFASNLWGQYVESYKTQVLELIKEHGPENEEAIREHLFGLMKVDLQLGQKESDIAIDQPKKLNFLEQFQARAQGNVVGRFVANPFTMGVLANAASRATLRAGLMTATAAFMAPATASVVVPIIASAGAGALYAAFRRSKELKQDFSQERIQMAVGRVAAGKKAGAIREHILHMVDAGQRARELNSPNVPKEVVAETIARLELEKDQDVQELFHASSDKIDLATRQIDMNNLRRALRELDKKEGYSRDDLKELIENSKKELGDEITKKNEVFNQFKRNQSLKAALQGATSAIAGAIISQEILHQIRGGDTILRHAFHKFDINPSPDVANDLHNIPGVQASMHTPVGVEFHDHPGQGSGDLIFKGEHIADNLKYDEHGRLLDESKNILRSKGFEVTENFETKTINFEYAKDIVSSGAAHEATLDDLHQKFGDVDWGTHARVDWHHQGAQTNFYERLVEHPGKEQMLYLEKGSDGKVVMDAHKVLENIVENLKNKNELFINPDGTTDSQMKELVEKMISFQEKGELGKHLQAVIIPDKHSALSAVFAADESGKATLSEKLSNICTPENLHDGKLPFMVELRLDGHVLATASPGESSMFKEVFERVAEKIPSTLEISDTYIVPISTGMEDSLPTSFAARYGLETVKIEPLIPTAKEIQESKEKNLALNKVVATYDLSKGKSSEALSELELRPRRARRLPVGIDLTVPQSEQDPAGEKILDREPEQLDLPEDMRMRAENEILEDVRFATAMMGEKNPIKTQQQFEKALKATYDVFLKAEGAGAIDAFAQFMFENFKLRPGDWKFGKRGKIELARKEKVAEVLKTFSRDKAVEKSWQSGLAKSVKDFMAKAIPHMRINLIRADIGKPLPKQEK
jgi:hypothetical protein